MLNDILEPLVGIGIYVGGVVLLRFMWDVGMKLYALIKAKG